MRWRLYASHALSRPSSFLALSAECEVRCVQVMISTLIGAVPSIISALFFLAIWIFLFSAIGMQYLPNLKHGEVIDKVVNAVLEHCACARDAALRYISYFLCTLKALPTEWRLIETWCRYGILETS